MSLMTNKLIIERIVLHKYISIKAKRQMFLVWPLVLEIYLKILHKISSNSNGNSDEEEDTHIPVSQRMLNADAATNTRGKPKTKKAPKQPPTAQTFT